MGFRFSLGDGSMIKSLYQSFKGSRDFVAEEGGKPQRHFGI
jgi:hypothetical protein